MTNHPRHLIFIQHAHSYSAQPNCTELLHINYSQSANTFIAHIFDHLTCGEIKVQILGTLCPSSVEYSGMMQIIKYISVDE